MDDGPRGLGPAGQLARVEADQLPILTVLGNLIDDAVDAITGDSETTPPRVRSAMLA